MERRDLGFLILVGCLLGCSGPHSTPSGPVYSGGWTGGGGFQFNNSKAFLKKVSAELSDEISRMDPVIFSEMPSNRGPTIMAKTIRSIRSEYDTVKSRTNPDGESEGLMFDYGQQDNQIYLVALRPYFEAYQFIPVDEINRQMKVASNFIIPDFYLYNVSDLKRRLFHEFGHLMNLDEDHAERFANNMMSYIDHTYVACDATTTAGDSKFLLIERTGQHAWFFDQKLPDLTDDPWKEMLARGYHDHQVSTERAPIRYTETSTQDELNFVETSSSRNAAEPVRIKLNSRSGVGRFENVQFAIGKPQTGSMKCQTLAKAVSIAN